MEEQGVKEIEETEIPTMEEPVTEVPTTEEPVTEESPTEEPVAEEPVAEEPVAEEPVAEESVAEEPVAEESVVEEPATEVPIEVEIRDDCAMTEPIWEAQAWLLRTRLECAENINGYAESITSEVEAGTEAAEKVTRSLRESVASCCEIGAVMKEDTDSEESASETTTSVLSAAKCEPPTVEGVDCAAQDATMKDIDIVIDKSLSLIPSTEALPAVVAVNPPENLKSLIDTESNDNLDAASSKEQPPAAISIKPQRRSRPVPEEPTFLTTETKKSLPLGSRDTEPIDLTNYGMESQPIDLTMYVE